MLWQLTMIALSEHENANIINRMYNLSVNENQTKSDNSIDRRARKKIFKARVRDQLNIFFIGCQ